MFLKLTSLFVFLGVLSLSAAYKITPNVVNGIPGSLNISTAPFLKIGGSYYRIESKEVNWYAAFESCRQMEAELIAFENLEEIQLIYQYLIDNNIVAQYWTAGTDLAEQDKHVWFSNGQRLTSDLWLPGEPSNTGKAEHCDETKIAEGVGMKLNDRKCADLIPYICKAPQPKTASFIIW